MVGRERSARQSKDAAALRAAVARCRRLTAAPALYQFSSRTRVFRGSRNGMRCGQCGGEVQPCDGASLDGSAQLFAQAEEELGTLGATFARGEFTGLLEWLRAKVYRQGRRYSTDRLIQRVTGSPLDPRPLVRSLQQRYLTLHGIDE